MDWRRETLGTETFVRRPLQDPGIGVKYLSAVLRSREKGKVWRRSRRPD